MDYFAFLLWESNKNAPCFTYIEGSPVQSENVFLQPNTIKRCFVLSSQTLSNMFE